LLKKIVIKIAAGSTVLKMDLRELAKLKSVPKTVDAVPICCSVVFVPSAINLVEVIIGEPPSAHRWFLRYKLGEESLLAAMSVRSVNGS
jgi:hypothetical protein